MHSYTSRGGRWPLALTLAALVALGTGCAQPSRFSTSTAPMRAPSSLSDVTVSRATSPNHTITRAEFATVSGNTAYDLVFRLRPEFLRGSARGGITGTRNDPAVYINTAAAGTLSALRQIPVDAVAEIHYVPRVDALIRYGPTYLGGVIVVNTRR